MQKLFGVLAVSIGVAAAFLAKDARALGPVDLELAAKAGGATPPGGHSPSPLGFGLGARAGVAIFGLYGGLSIINYFGESQGTQALPGVTTSVHALMYGVEAGYGGKLFELLTLRAQLGVGNYGETVDLKTSAGSTSATNNGLYLEPAVVALLPLGPIFIGADAGVLLLPSRTYAPNQTDFEGAFTLHAQLGVKF